MSSWNLTFTENGVFCTPFYTFQKKKNEKLRNHAQLSSPYHAPTMAGTPTAMVPCCPHPGLHQNNVHEQRQDCYLLHTLAGLSL